MEPLANAAQASAGLHALDWVVLGVYLLGMVAVGASFYKNQKTTKDFFLAGRSMSWIPVGLSVVATLFSAISYMAIPSAIQRYGIILVAGATMIFFCIPLVAKVFMPFYNRMQLYSAYEYLEYRFDVRVRCVASGLFILWRIIWMSIAVYAPSLALWAATGSPVPLWVIIIILGTFATAYTYLGGMKAVIWTDVIQFLVLFGGMVLAAILIIFQVDGGVAGIFQTMQDAGKLSFVGKIPEMASAEGFLQKMRAYFCTSEATLIGTLVASFIGHAAFYCVDQVTVQRYFTAKSLKHAQKSFSLNAFANVCLHIGLAFLGMALFAYFAAHPPPQEIAGQAFRHDWRYPYFIATAMPVGVAGLLIAALYAATMSSVDSGINSCCTAFLVDFWQRLKYGEVSPAAAKSDERREQDQLMVAKVGTLVLGVVVVICACLIPLIGESIILLTNKLVNSLCGPMFAIFLLGMFTKRARPLGVCIGALFSLLLTYTLIFDKINFLLRPYKLSFQWPAVFSLVVALVVGYVLSLLEKKPDITKLEWTFSMQRKLWKGREAHDRASKEGGEEKGEEQEEGKT